MGIISDNHALCSSLDEAIRKTFGEKSRIAARQKVYGGDANDAFVLTLSDGMQVFLKINREENADSLLAEADGLEIIKATGTIRVPVVYAIGKSEGIPFLLMEYIKRGAQTRSFWEEMGSCLAAMHMSEKDPFVKNGKYGLNNDNYIGAGKQKNTPKERFIEFFSECRLKPQFKLAEHYFDADVISAAGRLMDHLDRFLYEPTHASVIHGDLWSGNVMADETGHPVLIDPAVYVGCSEADIAMTELFGGFDRRFYAAYFDGMGMVPGYEDRRDLYNLYHLLNHLNLFGPAYLHEVISIIAKYDILN